MEGRGVGAEVVDPERGLEADRDNCGGDGRLAAAAFVATVGVNAVLDGVALDVMELVPGSNAVVGVGPFVGREVPHAPAVMIVTIAIATPTTQRRRGAGEDRPA